MTGICILRQRERRGIAIPDALAGVAGAPEVEVAFTAV
jgi:hypothetical protein